MQIEIWVATEILSIKRFNTRGVDMEQVHILRRDRNKNAVMIINTDLRMQCRIKLIFHVELFLYYII